MLDIGIARITVRLSMRVHAAISGVTLCGLFFAGSASGSVEALMTRAADAMRRAGAPGAAIVAVVKGRTYYANAGVRDRAGDPVTENTLFETASIAKVFTTALLGIDIARGRVSLNSRITNYDRGPLSPEMQRVTLAMLATYSAGIPNLPPALVGRPSSTWGIADYPVSAFVRFIGGLHPSTLPAPSNYSDSSVGFLGLCLGHMSLRTWESRQRKELYLPLGMRDTDAEITPEQASRLSDGNQPGGTVAPRWPFDAFVAADGVKSTSHDLGNFLAAELGRKPNVPRGVRLGLAIATRPQFSILGGSEQQALAWTWIPGVVHGKPVWIIMKGGNLVGFSSRICFSRSLGVGVAILANHPNMPTLQVAQNLLQNIAREVDPPGSVTAER